MPSKPLFFESFSAWRGWLEKHHADTTEVWVGLHKRDSGRPGITWSEAVDGALCFGWIDGIRKGIDDISYKNRFTPRKPRSIWSAINVKRVSELSALGLMHPAGQAAFEKRDGKRSEIYSYEQRKNAKLPAAYEKEFRRHPGAWKFFRAQAPWYQRTSTYWVISAKKEETRLKRLAALVDCSERQCKIPPLARGSGR
ncbi:MAG TPA: YdeI/OmpD-associated family protein [Candidatus Sulfotelmatobacter sp.]